MATVTLLSIISILVILLLIVTYIAYSQHNSKLFWKVGYQGLEDCLDWADRDITRIKAHNKRLRAEIEGAARQKEVDEREMNTIAGKLQRAYLQNTYDEITIKELRTDMEDALRQYNETVEFNEQLVMNLEKVRCQYDENELRINDLCLEIDDLKYCMATGEYIN